MRVICITNSIEDLNDTLSKYAFTQNDTGKVDLTVGVSYEVYGTQKNKLGDFYFILTDEINKKLPWWMPANFFKTVENSIPASWQYKALDTEILGICEYNIDPIYFGHEEDIEDATDKGHVIFEQMKSQNNHQ